MRIFDVDDPRDAARFVARMAARPSQLDPLWAWGVRMRFSRPAVRRLIDEVRSEVLLTPAELGALPMPVLCLWGREDHILPEAHRQFFRANLPAHAAFEEPPGYGHAPFLDRPGHLTGRIRDFLDRVVA
jgi:pimeloyl-ACP methyl ester carboxylesterase